MPKGNFNRYTIGCGALKIKDFALDVADVDAAYNGDVQKRNKIVKTFVEQLKALKVIEKSSEANIIFDNLVIKTSKKHSK